MSDKLYNGFMSDRLYTGFVCDRARELGIPLHTINAASRRVGNTYETQKRLHPVIKLERVYVANVVRDNLDRIILGKKVVPVCAASPHTPVVTEPSSSLVDDLRAVVTALNNMANAVAAKDRDMELMRREIARLSAAARRAMAVYGD